MLIAVLALVVILVVVLMMRLKNGKVRETDYRSLFWLGIFFLGLYIVSGFFMDTSSLTVFFILGIIYTIMGVAHRGSWGKERKELSVEKSKMMMKLTIAGLITFLVGVAVYAFLI